MNKDTQYLIATPEECFFVNTIEEAIYAWGVTNGTIYIVSHGTKKSYKYLCDIIKDKENDR